MKKIITDNKELLEVLTDNGINITCSDSMAMLITDEDAARIDALVEEIAPAAEYDYTIEELTYDVCFDDDTASDCKHFRSSIKDCRAYIKCYNRTNVSYFEDYKGGIVSIRCNETGETIYEEEIPD